MLILALCIVAMLSPKLFGGSLSRLAHVRFRGIWILLVALVAQILIIEIFPEANRTFLESVHLATYVAAGLFVAINWRVPGLLVIAAGGAMNGITIALNGGQLPASKPALNMAGIEVGKGEFINSGYIKDPVMPLLGDIFVWPEPFPLANVFSFGDVCVVIGVFYGANKIAGSRLVKTPWRLPDEDLLEAGDEESAGALADPASAASDQEAPASASPGREPPRRRRHAAPPRTALESH
ncbi:MAG: DUF5317 family protein [Actinomycetes bacterium]